MNEVYQVKVETGKKLKRIGRRIKADKKLSTGRFTYFPHKQFIRSWRVTKKADELLREAGERIEDPTRIDPQTGEARRVGTTDVLETLARTYAPTLTFKDIEKAMHKDG